MQKTFTKAFNGIAVFFILCAIAQSTIAQNQNALTVLKQYALLNKEKLKISQKDAESLSIIYNYVEKSSGIQHIYATQKLNGLTITNSNFSLHGSGNLTAAASKLVSFENYKISPVSDAIGSKDAIGNAMDATGYSASRVMELKQAESGTDKFIVYKRNNSSIWDIPCRMVYYNNERIKTLTPAWEIQMMDAYKAHYWLVYVNAVNGKILEKKDLIIHCDFGGGITDATADQRKLPSLSIEEKNDEVYTIQNANESETGIQSLPSNKYRVYNIPYESPIDPGSTHSLITKGGDTLASPDGWHKVGNALTYNYTHGNNVWAFQDPSPGPEGGVPSADPTRTAYPTNTTAGVYPVVEPFVFDYPINLTTQPQTYQNAAIVNLFFWNNLMHDVAYYFGFDEASGNFQESNTFSTGTRGSLTNLGADEVLAQAQDGGGTNNANFLTLPDGTNGQMQMYLWTASFPDSLVQVTSSTSGTPPAGKKYLAVQGSFSTLPTDSLFTNLYTHPVTNKQYALAVSNSLSTVGTPNEGCSTGQQSIALPDQNVNGKIAVIDRGDCSFVEKVLGAQLGGAVGAVIINNVDGPPLAMGGTDAPANTITIPAVMISKADGAILKAQLSSGAAITGSLKRDKAPAPERDGDIDNGVMCHEYTHGISNRLTGGGSLLPLGGDEQGGEGWSDFMALYMTLRKNDLKPANSNHPFGILPLRSIGNYVTYQVYDGAGIREFPYSTDKSKNPATFSYIKRPDYSETHSVGFVWCTMLYELLQNFIDQYGMNDNVYEGANPTSSHNPPATAKGNNIAVRLVIEGMKLQPVNPTFIEERDAILSADTLLYNGQHSCMIWRAFAKRGLGYSASSGTNALGDETEAFDLPFSCDPTQKRISIVKSGPGKIQNKKYIQYTITITNKYPKYLNKVTVTDTLPTSLNFIKSSLAATANGKIRTWTFSLGANKSKTITVTGEVISDKVSTALFSDDQEAGSGNWTAGGTPSGAWVYSTDSMQAYSGSHYWFVSDYDLGGSNATLQTKNAVNIKSGAELVFIHKYAAESGYDGGVVEVSQDGTTWTYLPPTKFVQNGYSGIIPTANNPSIGTADESAFTGTSDGYITSIASLADYVGKNIYIRFRMTSDATGGSITGGGWWLDDVYILTNRTQVTNTATAVTAAGAPVVLNEGTNAYSTTSAFILGTTTPSNAVAEKIHEFKATLYPNPAKDVANILINNPSENIVSINLYDVRGKQLATFNAGKIKDKTISLPVQQLASGTYFIEVKTESDSRTMQMIIQK